ncbi:MULTISPECIES: hypothetical protein [Streptomyces violaceusniger group]|uniref:hypothetical protein n=1 Tax=Streptomyces violaceusniger group TaxID=2839105 RepID=UPI001BA91575|nr:MULTISPECIES: hypothetical protein [Streptomyces violaceusniger group]
MAHSTARGRRHAANGILLFIRENIRDAIGINCLADLLDAGGKSLFAPDSTVFTVFW